MENIFVGEYSKKKETTKITVSMKLESFFPRAIPD